VLRKPIPKGFKLGRGWRHYLSLAFKIS
jgi:hypothetical protein